MVGCRVKRGAVEKKKAEGEQSDESVQCEMG